MVNVSLKPPSVNVTTRNYLNNKAIGEPRTQRFTGDVVRVELVGNNLQLFEHANGQWSARFVENPAGKKIDEANNLPRERAMLLTAMYLLSKDDRDTLNRIFPQGK